MPALQAVVESDSIAAYIQFIVYSSPGWYNMIMLNKFVSSGNRRHIMSYYNNSLPECRLIQLAV